MAPSERPPVLSVDEQHRAVLSVGDRVHFSFRGDTVQGVLLRVNPTRGHVATEEGHEYRVPYRLLQQLEEQAEATLARSQAQLEEIATVAHDLLRCHQLPQWSFQFDNGTKRAGCCHYGTQVIALAYEFARRAPEEAITDTILHEIAHALVGRAHHHDEVWRAKALEIGCSGRRCHELQFTPPRYIVRCERRCWVATVERRQRGVRCKRCQGAVVYETYTEERWHRRSEESS